MVALKHQLKWCTAVRELICSFSHDWPFYLFVPLSSQRPCLSEYQSRGTGWIRVPAQQPTPLSNGGHLLPKSSVSKTESAEKISIINIPFNTSPAGQTVWRSDSVRWRMLFLSYMDGYCNAANRGSELIRIYHAVDKWPCLRRSKHSCALADWLVQHCLLTQQTQQFLITTRRYTVDTEAWNWTSFICKVKPVRGSIMVRWTSFDVSVPFQKELF